MSLVVTGVDRAGVTGCPVAAGMADEASAIRLFARSGWIVSDIPVRIDTDSAPVTLLIVAVFSGA